MFILNVHCQVWLQGETKERLRCCSADILCSLVRAVPGCSDDTTLTMIPKIKTFSENCCVSHCPENEMRALNYCKFLVGKYKFTQITKN